jgi:phage protein D
MGLGASIRTGTPGVADADFGVASQVEVYERLGEATTYAIRLPVLAQGSDLSWLADGRVLPGKVLGVYVAQGAQQTCLVRGPVTGHAARLVHGSAGSHVDVLGADASVNLDRSFRTRVWQDARDADAVTSIVGEAGFVPDVSSTSSVHRSDLRNLAQADTDLRFVRRLARRNGFLAWLTTDALSGIDTFHFKAPDLSASSAATLSINQPGANADAIDLRWDSQRPTEVDALQLDFANAENLDASATRSPSRALGSQRLSDVLPEPRTSRVVAPGDDSAEVKARAEGAAFEAEWFVQATLETTLAALGAPVRAPSVVELRGAGSLHSGKWLVAAVRHSIDATGHRMTVDLVRNAWGG